MSVNTEELEYTPLEIESLEVGMLLDRPLYVHLPTNNRYVLLVKPLQQLEEATFAKLKRFGKIFTIGSTVVERYPELAGTAKILRTLCDDNQRAPFEKNREVYEATRWLYPLLFGAGADVLVPIFFVRLAFDVPRPETLLHVSDFSVESYERGIALGAIACLLAAWLGYTDSAFLSQFAETTFCRELVEREFIPGVDESDHRFRVLAAIGDNFAATGDELAEVVQLARWIARGAQGDMPRLRVSRKLKQRFAQAATAAPGLTDSAVNADGKAAA